MNTTRSKTEHDMRRRVYETGLSVKGLFLTFGVCLELTPCEAVREYEDRVFRSAEELDIAFLRLASKPINISTWFQYFAFDIMGELGFGKSFDQVKTAKSHFETEFLREGMSILAFVTPVPWLYHLGLSIPGLTRDWQALLSWSARQAKQKIKVSGVDHDCTYRLILEIGASRTT